MALKRVDFAVEWVQRRLRYADTKRQMEVDPDLILFEMFDVQDEIAREALALPFRKVIVTASGVDRYSTGVPIFKMGSIKAPVEWPIATVVTSPKIWDDVRRTYLNLTVPTFFFFEGNTLSIYPTPTVSGLEVEVHAYGLPDKEDVQLGKDFPLDIMYDKATRYGTLAEFDDSFAAKYRAELDKVIQLTLNRSAADPLILDHTSRTLGF